MNMNFDYNYKNDPNRVGVIRVKDLIYNEYADGTKKLKPEPIQMVIHRGTDITSSAGCIRIDEEQCLKQAKYSLEKQRFHPKTREMLLTFMEDSPYPYDIEHWFDNTTLKTPMDYKVLGMCELLLGMIDLAHRHNAFVPFHIFQLENGLHPCYVVRLTEVIVQIYKYSETKNPK